MLAALRASRGRCQAIEPEFCVEYVSAWRRDRDTWRQHLDQLDGWLPCTVKRLVQLAEDALSTQRMTGAAPTSVSLIRDTRSTGPTRRARLARTASGAHVAEAARARR
jgi:hypothetical protein